MQQIKNLSESEYRAALQRGDLGLRVGPYTYKLQTSLPTIIDGTRTLYADFPVAARGNFADYHIAMGYANTLARFRRRVDFHFDHQRPFASIKENQAYASLEWGMNWCVSIYANEYLKLHAAVVARNNAAIVMPGVPGAGKSTLCAALGLSGWRVLSDEHALIPPGTAEVVPLYRPVSLKNESISVIRAFDDGAVFGPTSTDTHKGVVAHLKADIDPKTHDPESLPARIMLFPRYSTESPQRLSHRRRTDSFILAAYHSFNYSLLGRAGFHAMETLVDAVDCYDLVYNDLDWALNIIGELHTRTLAA